MSKFANLQSTNQFQKKHKDKQLIKESTSNQVIGAIDEKKNLFILNPSYTLSIGYALKNNYDTLSITNRRNVGIKISKNDVKITNSNSEEQSLLDIIQNTVDEQLESIDQTLNQPKNEYTDSKAFKACNDKVNAKTINNCKVDNEKSTNKNLWTGRKITKELSTKSNQDHEHLVEDIKNLPLSNIVFKDDLNVQVNEINNELNIHINQLHQEVENKLNQGHVHSISSLGGYDNFNHEITKLKDSIKNKSDSIHTHKDLLSQISNKVDSQDLEEFQKYTENNFVSNQLLISKLREKANSSHQHTEKSIQDLDKYSKLQVDRLLEKRAKTNHSHSSNQISDPEEIYSDQDTTKVVNNLIDREILITKKDVLNRLTNKAPLDHSHNIDHNLDIIFDKLKIKLRDYLKENLTAKNATHLENQPARNFAVVNHSHTFHQLKDTKHTHSELEIKNLDKYTKKEVNTLLDRKSNKKHKHNISEITNLPKQYSDRDVRQLITNEFINDDTLSPGRLFSSSKIDSLVNSKAPSIHNHKISEIKDIKGYIERTVEIAVKQNINNHTHSYFNIQDKPKKYLDGNARTAVGGQVNDHGTSQEDIWSANKIKNELEYLHSLIKK